MDFDAIASQWLRQIRGRRSQRGFSRRLGYRTNIAYRWEAGACFPTARELFAIAERFGLVVSERVRTFLGATPDRDEATALASTEGLARFLRELQGDAPIVALARRSGFSRFTVSRWLSGSAEPRVPEFLAFLEATTLRALDFVACFTDPLALPAAADEWRALEAARDVAYESPWSSAVLHALELAEYRALPRHRPGFLAKQLGIRTDQAQAALEALVAARLVRADGKRFVIDRTRALDTRADPVRSRSLRAHWITVARDRLLAGAPGAFGYNIMALSHADHERLKEVYVAYFREMQAIVAQSSGDDVVVLFNTQLLPLAAPPHGGPAG